MIVYENRHGKIIKLAILLLVLMSLLYLLYDARIIGPGYSFNFIGNGSLQRIEVVDKKTRQVKLIELMVNDSISINRVLP